MLANLMDLRYNAFNLVENFRIKGTYRLHTYYTNSVHKGLPHFELCLYVGGKLAVLRVL